MTSATLTLDPSIFKAYDIRGIIDASLSTDAVYWIGRALGAEAEARGEQHFYVARDGRLSGPKLIEALIRGLREAGRDVTDLGMVPTPVLYYAAYALGTGSGIMLTGSHNPPNYNGLKMVIGGTTLAGADIQALRQRIEISDLTQGEGRFDRADVVPQYIERITSDIQLARPMKVIVDCGNGVAGVAAPQLLRALGCEVTELFCEVDGNFPNHHPDPSQPENLEDLKRALAEQEVDIGLAFDGDGDRLGVVTASGAVIWADRQMMLYARDVISRNPGAEIIYDIKCTSHLARVIEEAGGKPLMWKTGHSFIKAKLKETGDLLAGEMSGHIFFKERWYGFDDALYTAARLLEILAADGRPADEIFNALPDSINTPELKLHTPEGENHALMERLQAAASFPDARITTIDGIRADFSDGFGLVRASNTTPCLVIRFEAEDAAGLARIQGEFRQLILSQAPEAELPF
ncbi:MAG: phosphomannomutase/phosphoglucomutase [Gammaproteobacteria bacterium]|nr:phosphomannomutase/phosphoglucomutase [Gammaproteobacteria bacterium]MCF6364335.1 phosphomannomutase/phosphoglucomutase [Gammaproteobacteria bacterium]